MGKVVLITGASSGIGLETARLLAASGYTVYGGARRVGPIRELEDVKALELDVTVDESMVRAVETVIKNEGHIDILVNSAGYGLYGTVEDVPGEDARRQFDVNVFGLARMTQLVLPHMRSRRTGKIVNISSIGGKVTSPLGGWYYASKHAVEGLSDSLRVEVGPFGIDVIIIEPGGIKTQWPEIAAENLRKVSEGSAYKRLTDQGCKFFREVNAKGSEPVVIARLIKKSVEARKPRTRYHKGHLSGISLFGRRFLCDRLFDKVMLRQLGIKQ